MKINKYIKEYSSFVSKDKPSSDFDSPGVYVEYLYNLNDDFKNIIREYIVEYDPTVRIANVVDNMMPKDVAYNLVQMLTAKHQGADTLDVYENAKPGRNIFTSFLKVISAMGGKNNSNVAEETPDDFILYYTVKDIDGPKFESIIKSRFKSLSSFIEFDSTSNTDIYFGINSKMKFEYGILNGNNHNEIGNFPLTESSKKWILSLNSQSAAALKRDLIENDVKNIKFLSNVKTSMVKLLNDLELERGGIYLNEDLMIVPIKNIGTWSNGSLTNESLKELKVTLNKGLLKYKWSENILTSIQPNNYAINFFIKLK